MIARGMKMNEDVLYELVFGSDWRLVKISHEKTSIVRQLMLKLNSEQFDVELGNDGHYVIDVKGYGFKIGKEDFETWYNVS